MGQTTTPAATSDLLQQFELRQQFRLHPFAGLVPRP